jgi:hypothetical protein
MAFKPDIVVTSDDGVDTSLIVEVTLQQSPQHRIQDQIQRYMSGIRCPLGMVVTPRSIQIYRDRYTSLTPSSIELLGEYPTSGSFTEVESGPDTVSRAYRFESEVQGWLERLASGSVDVDALQPDLRRAIKEHILPALTQGTIRAAGPRYRHPLASSA